jgi:hypothetical protein
MRGSPLLSVLVLAVLLGLAAIPLWSLTRPEDRPLPLPAPAAAASARPVEITLTATQPVEVELTHSGTTVWTSRQGNTEIPLPDGALELVATARWAGATAPQAARIVLTRDGETLGDETFWGDSETTAVLTLPGTEGVR